MNELASLMEDNLKSVVEDFQGHKFCLEIVGVKLRLMLHYGLREEAMREKTITKFILNFNENICKFYIPNKLFYN